MLPLTERVTEAGMKKVAHNSWRIRRELVVHPDGQHRWDRAYQLLLAWTTPAPPGATTPGGKEVDHERGDLCASVESETSPGRDD
jgi:hypothetical protein